MVGREDAMGNDEPPPGSKKLFWRSASWSASRTASQVSEGEEQSLNIPCPNSSGPGRRCPPPPLTPRSHHNSKARACLPPLQPLSISRRSLDEWPKAGSDDVGEWPHPPTPSGNKTTGERLKLDLSSTQQRVSDKSAGLAKREKIAYFDKECSKVADHIYVGGDAVAKDKNILKNNGITHILNCVGFICPEYFKSDFCYRSLWLQDSPSEDITSILYDVFDYFEDVREQSGRIFVHCCQGVSRSTSLVIAYLMWREGQSFDDAFQYVKSARGIADPNMGFACQLLQCQKRVHAFPLSPTSLLRMYRMSPHSPYDPLHLVPKLLNDPCPSSLDSRGAFIIHLPSAIYIWVGRQCETIMERDAKAAVCQIARYEKVEAPIMVVREGDEPAYYWDAFASILPMIGGSVVKIQPGDRKVDAYNLDFEIFQKAIEGGFVPTLASSNNEHETHLPARENSWSSLKCKFASRFEKGFRYVSKTPLSRVYSDSMMIVHSSASPSSTTSSSSSASPPFLSPDSVCSTNSGNSLKSFSQSSGRSSLRSSSIPPSLTLPKFSSLSLLPSQTSPKESRGVNNSPQPYIEPSPNRKASPSLAERRGSLKGSLKLPGIRNGDLNTASDCKERTADSDLPQKEMISLISRSRSDKHKSGGDNLGQPLACRWPSMEMITELSRGCLDSESVIAIPLPSDAVGETGSRILYIWIGKSFSFDNNCSLIDSNKAADIGENVDWIQVGESILSQMDLPKDTPIKIVREAEDQTEFLALLSVL
ncbi:PREDICTED: protein-tyrosine-phosphatase MKP1 isoform X2 [Camelina sativa]|uniref:Protein-tyrosine-phosphatase MKP1 isoform X2 n=1 Tax=Camelina sativa TaxID=90675 RepID=A0ABM0YQE0_CAMSA|nr:PREDICTED: protein-tyrosine-phosphatase MKP1 isoform X2 [Camelina sativa]